MCPFLWMTECMRGAGRGEIHFLCGVGSVFGLYQYSEKSLMKKQFPYIMKEQIQNPDKEARHMEAVKNCLSVSRIFWKSEQRISTMWIKRD